MSFKDSFGETIEEYEILNLLGKGGFACVYKARCKNTNLFVAIKMINKKLMQAAGMVDRVRQEVSIHSRLKHSSILELYTFFEDFNHVYLVLELAHNGELQRFLKDHKKVLTESEAAEIMQQVVSGLLYLHSHKILHRDMSLSNLLLTKDMQVKIADFGLATQLARPDEKHMTMCGTPNYISPEVASRSSHSLPADIWGLGCMFYTLLVGRPPFDTEGIKSTLNKVVLAEYDIPNFLSNEARDLIDKFLKKNPAERIKLEHVLRHPFFLKHQKLQSCDTFKNSVALSDSGINTFSSERSHRSTRSRSADRFGDLKGDYRNEKEVHPRHIHPSFGLDHQLHQDKKETQDFILNSLHNECCTTTKQTMDHQFCTEQSSKLLFDIPNSNSSQNSYKFLEDVKYQKSILDDGYSSNSINHKLFTFKEEEYKENLFHKYENQLDNIQVLCEDNLFKKNLCEINHDNKVSDADQIDNHNFLISGPAFRGLKENFEAKIPVPHLSTERLQQTRHKTKNAVMSITEDGEVVIEFLKYKRNIHEERVIDVCWISSDGMRIIIYQPNEGRGIPVLDKPPPKSFSNGTKETYNYNELPSKHWKKYIYAARFVNLVKRKTPKVTFYNSEAKCQLMENLETFEMFFCNGAKIIRSENDVIKLTDEHGLDFNIDYTHIHNPDIKRLLKQYNTCFNHCKYIERVLSQIPGTGACFPVIIGRKTYVELRGSSGNVKENSNIYQTPKSRDISSIDFTMSASSSLQSTVSTSRKPFNSNIPIKSSNIPGIGRAVQLSQGVVEIQFYDSTKLSVIPTSIGGGITFTNSNGSSTHYANVENLPKLVREKYSNVPTVIKHLKCNETKVVVSDYKIKHLR
ncbi:serine/threonine-protein kinase PLK4 [Condylostylus longicornis]|uniref:serine/threonine-protein kinase PLK4 n=1 Tax=Condylostylus longicornis TaxID=2530218 RepID=UPI00244DB69A|nr:serine/threonine-protein kinase PLK4 [Condylostylus longicornis]